MARHRGARTTLTVAALLLAAAPVFAQEGLFGNLRVIFDTNVSSSSNTVTDSLGNVVRTTSDDVLPRLTVDAQAMVYSNLRLSLGGVFDVDFSSTSQNSASTDTRLSRLRPFFELRSTDATLSPGFGYYRRDISTRVGSTPAVKLTSEDYSGFVAWNPLGGPHTDVQFVRTNQFDGDKTIQDLTRNYGAVASRYTQKDYTLTYNGSYLGSVDRRRNIETSEWTNGARVEHSHKYFDQRLTWNTTYYVTHQSLTTLASADESGEVALPIIPFAGLSATSDAPSAAVLTTNVFLVDGNTTAAAGVNLGLPPLGGDAQARNIGLDFTAPTEVSRLRVWISRDLPADVANSFTWEVYSSRDNITWTREALVNAAPFGPFETRFEVDFPTVTARYVKLVTRPLSAAVVNAAAYTDVFVTELQAFVRKPAAQARGRQARTSQFLTTDARLQVFRTPWLFYEGSYWYTGVLGTGQRRDTLSNGALVEHRFARIYSVYGRAAVEHGMQYEGRRTAFVQNGTFTVNPIRTFTASLLYNSRDERIAGRPSDRRGLLVQTNAQLYRGVDVQFGGGWNFTTTEVGARYRDGIVNVTTNIVPRQNLLFSLNYSDTTTRRTDVVDAVPSVRTRRGYATVAVDPVRTLHLVYSEELLATTGEKTRRTHNVGVNWSPFADGSLQLIVAYDNALRPLEFGSERVFRPGVRWVFSRPSYIEISYQRIRSEYVFARTDSKVIGADVKIFF